MSISDAIREKIESSGMTRYQIAQGSGVSQGVLSRFMAGENLSLVNADKLAEYFGLELKTKSDRSKRRGKADKG